MALLESGFLSCLFIFLALCSCHDLVSAFSNDRSDNVSSAFSRVPLSHAKTSQLAVSVNRVLACTRTDFCCRYWGQDSAGSQQRLTFARVEPYLNIDAPKGYPFTVKTIPLMLSRSRSFTSSLEKELVPSLTSPM